MFKLNVLLIVVLVISILLNILFLVKTTSKSESTIQSVKNGDMTYAFSEYVNDPKKLVLESLKSAESTIDIAMYNFEDPDIAEALYDASDRGVKIRVITDGVKAEKKSRAAVLDELLAHEIDVKVITSKKMHWKITLVDEQVIVTGSYNFTEESATDNMEQVLSISDESLAKEWSTVFETVWTQEDIEVWPM